MPTTDVIRHRPHVLGAAAALAVLGATLTASSTAVAAETRPAAAVDVRPAGDLPMTTTVRPDGVVETAVDPAAIRELEVAAAASGCGRACDFENPQTYYVTPPGGPSNWYTCASDAITARTAYLPGGSRSGVELRYSPRCRTAWARQLRMTHRYYAVHVRSYYVNGDRRTTAYEDPHVQYSVMLDDAGLKAAACVSYINDSGSGENFICTSKY